MKICFMGTPDFALKALDTLIKNGYNVVCVYTKEPKAKGRSSKLIHTPVAQYAFAHNIAVKHPKTLKLAVVQEEFLKQKFDLVVVAAYGLILPKVILESPKYGCINIHASLLPKWRGASPIQMAIKNQDTQTGITTMLMDEKMDTGDILLQQATAILSTTTFESLWNELGDIGAHLIVKTIKQLENGTLEPLKQDNTLATYAPILKKEDGQLNFNKSATEIASTIRAYNPYPSTYFTYNNIVIKVKRAAVVSAPNHNFKSGEIISAKPLLIACQKDYLQPLVLQKAGKNPLEVEEFLRGFTFKVGDVLE